MFCKEGLPRHFGQQLLVQISMGGVEKDWKIMKAFLSEPHADFISKCEGIASDIIALSELKLCSCAQLVMLSVTSLGGTA